MISQDENRLRRILFTPVETKDGLARWIKYFLNIHLPDHTVSEESNSNPMDLLWELYSKAAKNDFEECNRYLVYASRASGKTLSASILELLLLLHFNREVAHMAAILSQSQVSQGYIRTFTKIDILRDFIVSENLKNIVLVRYQNKEGTILTEKEWQTIEDSEKRSYKPYSSFIRTILCTMQSANSSHVNGALVTDEVDVIPSNNVPAYHQAKAIPDPRDGILPFSLLTSTRKFAYGLVQKEIDEADKTGLEIRHWNIIDTVESCKPERHLPDEPKVKLYIRDDEIKHLTEKEYEELDVVKREKYTEREGFAGCAKCPLFSACRGRLATHQKSTSPMLKPIPDIINRFKSGGSDSFVITEYLCRKPDETGLIYPKLSKEIHFKTANQIAEMILGRPVPYELSKLELLDLMIEKDLDFYGGMDFGFTHKFAVTLGAKFGHFMFITHATGISGLELDDKIAYCEPYRYLQPRIYGDPAYPSDIKTFSRKGFNMIEWQKYPESVKGGIEVARMKLKPAVGDPQLFFLAGDPGVEFLFNELKKYHFITDEAGQVSDKPDKVDDDGADSFRYLVMNVFAPKGKIKIPETPPTNYTEIVQSRSDGSNNDWMKELVRGKTKETLPTLKGKKGKFRWDL